MRNVKADVFQIMDARPAYLYDFLLRRTHVSAGNSRTAIDRTAIQLICGAIFSCGHVSLLPSASVSASLNF